MESATSRPTLPKYKPERSGTHASTMLDKDPLPNITSKKGFAKNAITIETTGMGITDLRLPTYVDPTSQTTTTFQSANAVLVETTKEFHTANDELPSGKPCASSTRRREILPQATSNDSIKSTRGSVSFTLHQQRKLQFPQNN